MNQKSQILKWYKQPIPFGLLLLTVSGTWLGYWILLIPTVIEVTENSSIWATRGQFGDMFGALNALFSGLAFAGIIYTIRQAERRAGIATRRIENDKRGVSQVGRCSKEK